MLYSQNWLFELTLWIIPTFTAISWREAIKAWACDFCGDSNAKQSGMASLNPFKNLDPLGSVVAPFILILRQQPTIAWAKRVEVKSAFLKRGHVDTIIIVALAIASNLVMASIWHIILHLSQYLTNYKTIHTAIKHMAVDGIYINSALVLMHLIPIAPMDSSLIIGNMLPRFLKSMYNITAPFGHYLLVIALLSQYHEGSIKTAISAVANITRALVL